VIRNLLFLQSFIEPVSSVRERVSFPFLNAKRSSGLSIWPWPMKAQIYNILVIWRRLRMSSERTGRYFFNNG
jgi:hypothetical protein